MFNFPFFECKNNYKIICGFFFFFWKIKRIFFPSFDAQKCQRTIVGFLFSRRMTKNNEKIFAWFFFLFFVFCFLERTWAIGNLVVVLQVDDHRRISIDTGHFGFWAWRRDLEVSVIAIDGYSFAGSKKKQKISGQKNCGEKNWKGKHQRKKDREIKQLLLFFVLFVYFCEFFFFWFFFLWFFLCFFSLLFCFQTESKAKKRVLRSRKTTKILITGQKKIRKKIAGFFCEKIRRVNKHMISWDNKKNRKITFCVFFVFLYLLFFFGFHFVKTCQPQTKAWKITMADLNKLKNTSAR